MKTVLHLTCSFVATLGFAVFFNISKKILVWVGLVGAVGWMLSIFLIERNIGSAWAYLFASLIVAFLAEILAIRTKNPSTLFSIPGIYPLVPGYGLYKTMYHFTTNEMQLGLAAMITTLTNAGAIALGIIIMSSLGNIRKRIVNEKLNRKEFASGEETDSAFE